MDVFTTTAIGSTGPTSALLLGATEQPSSSSSSSSSSSWRFHFALPSASLRFSPGLHSLLNLAPQFLGFRVPFALIKPSVRGAQTALDRHRGNRYDDNNSDGGSHFRRQARSYHPAVTPNYHDRPHGSPSGFRGGRGGRRPFDSSPRHDAGGVRMFGSSGSGGRGGSGDRFYRGGERDFDGEFLDLPPPPPPPPPQQQFSGQKRGFGFPGRAGGGPPHSSEHPDAANFAKLFVGSVPRNATENDIRPLFEQHGHVIEVAIIRDKRTGQQQGCCFIKFATSDEANRAIRALHNQYTLPGGIGPIQVRYADGERERLGASEYKLFVGSLNKQATEKQVEEIFSPFGLVEDVYLMRDEMKQSRGCGFVKYSQREMALAAIIALNGSYTMRGCDQPLTVRFADPKRPRLGDSRPPPNFSEPTGASTPEDAWHPRSMGPSSVSGPRDFSGQLVPKSSDASMPSYPLPRLGTTEDGHHNTPVMSSSVPLQGINQPSPQLPLMQLQISPSQHPFNSPQNFPSSWTLQNQPTTSYSQTLTSYPMSGPMPTPFTQPIPSQPVVGPSGPFSATQPSAQQIATPATAQQRPLSMNLQYPHGSSLASRQQMASPVPQHSAHPFKQSPSPLAQKLSQQTQSLQASLQSSQQVFSQLQQQLQLMQPSSRDSTAPSESLDANLQLNRNMQQSFASSSTDTAGADLPSSAIAPSKCSWTEHTSPDGYQYYYNSVTGESRWVEPDELKIFKIQQQQRHNQVKESVQQPQIQSNPAVLRPHQGPQIEHMQLQTQLHSQQTQLSLELGYAQYRSAVNLTPDSTHFQQGVPAAQDWMWKSKQTGI